MLILHESEQSPAQQDELERERGWCCLSSTHGCGCEPAASLPIWGAQAATPNCIPEDALVPQASYETPHGIIRAEVLCDSEACPHPPSPLGPGNPAVSAWALWEVWGLAICTERKSWRGSGWMGIVHHTSSFSQTPDTR